jgi:uncharacterized protein (TIGR03435 family)
MMIEVSMRRSTQAIVLTAAFVVASWALMAQEPPGGGQNLSFEVASIKPNNSGRPFTLTNLRGGTYTSTSVTLQTLIAIAYNRRQPQLVGGPGWIATDRYDVIATAPAGTAPTLESVRPMLRALLEDRFALATHSETRDLPVYHLVLARSDRALGPRLVKAEMDCRSGRGSTMTPEQVRALGAALLGPLPERAQPCTTRSAQGRMLMGNGLFENFFSSLQSAVDRPIIDQTGLAGQYNVDLEWAAQPDDPSKPSIFTALQEQLGLKLESARGPVDVLVIDRAEKPTPN